MPVSLTEFSKALMALKEALAAEKNGLTRDATIQRFEFCVELAWKTSKKILDSNEVIPKQIIREMAQAKLIDDSQIWFDAIKYRNLSSHTYNETLAEEVYKFIETFYPTAKDLEEKLKKL